jgi:hypothetical protein
MGMVQTRSRWTGDDDAKHMGGLIAVDGKWGTCDPKQESRARELGIRKAKKAEQAYDSSARRMHTV